MDALENPKGIAADGGTNAAQEKRLDMLSFGESDFRCQLEEEVYTNGYRKQTNTFQIWISDGLGKSSI